MKKLIIHSPKFGRHVVFYDDEDHELISKYKWHVNYRGKSVYAKHSFRKNNEHISFLMHNLITGKKYIDHINRNGLDNRKQNLRICTNSDNQHNVGPNKKNTTGFKGVSIDKSFKTKLKYKVGLRVFGKVISAGKCFDSKIEAAKAYNDLAIKHHGEFAYLNKIK